MQYGVPAKSDLKGIVFYKPALFEADGYEVPTTFDEFDALVDTMAAADGPKPLCVGIESGTATGWMFTDWTEDMVLRQHGGDVYDGWVTNEVKFDDPRIIESMQTVKDLWTDENVFAPGGTISATNFGTPVAEAHLADDCYMVRHSNFFAGLYPAGTAFADPENPDAIDVFYFPDINGDGPVLTAGTIAGAFDDDPATMAVMEYLATPEYAADPSAEADRRARWQHLRLPLRCAGSGRERLPAARAAVPRDPLDRRLRPVRRWRPDAGRRRFRVVLVRGHVAGQR